jgi:hypothetical protein
MGKLLHSHREALRRWADWAEAEIAQWGGVTLDTGARADLAVFDEISASARDLQERAGDSARA